MQNFVHLLHTRLGRIFVIELVESPQNAIFDLLLVRCCHVSLVSWGLLNGAAALLCGASSSASITQDQVQLQSVCGRDDA